MTLVGACTHTLVIVVVVLKKDFTARCQALALCEYGGLSVSLRLLTPTVLVEVSV